MGYDLSGLNAVVTGAAQGLGMTIAETFVKAGCKVALVDMNRAKLEETARRLGPAVRTYVCDIVSDGAVAETVAKINGDFGCIDILVNNAGIASAEDLLDTPAERWRKTIDVNLTGTFNFTQAAARVMAARGKGGRIVNIASVAGRNGGFTVSPAYSSSKAGILGLTKASARQLAKYKITVNAVAPGSLESEMLNSFGADKVEALRKSMPLGRLGTFEDVARAVHFLVSREAEFIDGVCLDVNGGQFMAP